MAADDLEISDPIEQNRLPTQREDAPRELLKPPSQLQPDTQFRVLKGWFRADRTHSANWRAWASKWMAFRAGEQWSVEDRQLLNSEDRPAVVFNRVLTVLKAVAGMEINGRHEIQFIPRGTEDTKVNELLSAASKWMADGCDAEDEESQAFENCCTTGMGWTENRMSYEDDPNGLYVEESIDPREMFWDRKAKKKNLADAKRMWRVRRMSLSDARLMFPGKTKVELDATWATDNLSDENPQKTLEERRVRDPNTTETDALDDTNEVTIVHAQWVEYEHYWRVADEEEGVIHEMSDREYKAMTRMALIRGDELQFEAARLTRKKYCQAFLGGIGMLQPAGPPPVEGRFSWTCITGEFDASTGTWFGLVKVMEDPQRWANKWLSQVMHLLNTTAKGGIMAENDAFDDQREAEESWAFADRITWLAKGALSSDKPKIMPKPGQADVKGFADLMSFAISSIKDVIGVNLELLGQQDQNQPGVVEQMRKQAGMTVLATLFDSLRRFRKQVGRCRLFFIQTYLSDGRLIRVVGSENAQAVPLMRERTVGTYDVVIDDAPTSPNQKEANWAIIAPLLGLFKEQLMANPVLLANILEYSPLPSKLIDLIKQFATEAMNNPEAQKKQQMMEQLQMRLLTAQAAKDEGSAQQSQSVVLLNTAKAKLAEIEGLYKMAMSDNMLTDNERAAAEAEAARLEAEVAPLIAQAEAALKASQAGREEAEAGLTRMKAMRERLAMLGDSTKLADESGQAQADQRKTAAETLLALAKAAAERAKPEIEREKIREGGQIERQKANQSYAVNRQKADQSYEVNKMKAKQRPKAGA